MTFYAKVGSFDLPGTISPITVTGLEFQPKVVIFFQSGMPSTIDYGVVTSGQPGLRFGLGLAAISSGNGYMHLSNQNGQSSFHSSESSNSRVCVDNYYLPVDGFLSDGFTLTKTGIATNNKTRINYLALGGSDITDTRVSTYLTPASVGQYNVSDVGFQPDFLLICNPNSATFGSNSTAYCSWGIITSGFQGVIGGSMNDLYTRTYSTSGETVAIPYPATSVDMSVTNRQSFVQFHPSGFLINKVEGSSSSLNLYLAMKGGNYKAGYLNTRADYDLITASGMSFIPESVLFLSHNKPVSTPDISSIEATFSAGAATSPTVRRASSMHELYKTGVTFISGAEFNDEVYVNTFSGGLVSLMDYSSPTLTGFKAVMDDTETISGSFVLYTAFGGLNQPSYKQAYTTGSGYMVVPDSDISTSGVWYNEAGGSTLYPSLGDFNDLTYAWYDNAVWGAYFEVGLANPPSTPSGLHALVWRGKRKAGSRQASLKGELRQGSGIITTDIQTITDGDEHEFIKPLTTSEINSITNYNDLRIRVTILDII